jgi:hypothetical protein
LFFGSFFAVILFFGTNFPVATDSPGPTRPQITAARADAVPSDKVAAGNPAGAVAGPPVNPVVPSNNAQQREDLLNGPEENARPTAPVVGPVAPLPATPNSEVKLDNSKVEANYGLAKPPPKAEVNYGSAKPAPKSEINDSNAKPPVQGETPRKEETVPAKPAPQPKQPRRSPYTIVMTVGDRTVTRTVEVDENGDVVLDGNVANTTGPFEQGLPSPGDQEAEDPFSK